MGFTPYSQVVQQPEWKAPISLEYLYQGAKEKQAHQEQALSGIQKNIDYLYNLPTLPGADTEVKKKVIDNIYKNLDQVSTQDLTSPRAIAQINSMIASATENPDFQNVVRRGSDYLATKEKYDKLTSNGQYISPWNMQKLNKYKDYINNYSGQGNYLRNYDFSGDIYADTDISKEVGEIIKEMGDDGSFDINKYGHDILYKEKNKDKILANLQARLSPQAFAEFERKFSYQFDKNDLHQLRQNEFKQDYDRLKNLAIQYINAGDQTSAQYWNDRAEAAKNAYETESPEQAKQYYMGRQLEGYLDKLASANAYKNIQSWSNNQAYEANLQLWKEKEAAKYKAQLDAGLIEGIPAKADSKAAEAQNIFTELEQYKNDSNYNLVNPYSGSQTKAIPGILQDDIFKIEAEVPKFTESYDEEGNSKGSTKTITKEKISPSTVEYDKSTKTWKLNYPNGTVKTYTDQGLKEAISVKKPQLAKFFNQNNTSSQPENQSSVVETQSKEDFIKTIEKQYKISRDKFPKETIQWIDSVANEKGLK